MAARELIHRTGVPTVQHEQPLAHVGGDARTVQLSDRGSIDKRTSPTELFVTSISLRRVRAKRAASEAASSSALTQLTVDHAKLMFSPDELFGVFNGFWWASSEELAAGFWVREYHPPSGYEVVSTDTVRIPRLLLEATRTSQQIGRARVYIGLFALAGMTIDRRGRHAAYASYIRASSPEMALRLWQTAENGFPSSERGLAFAFQVSSHWIKGVLDSPPILEALEHDRVLRRRS